MAENYGQENKDVSHSESDIQKSTSNPVAKIAKGWRDGSAVKLT